MKTIPAAPYPESGCFLMIRQQKLLQVSADNLNNDNKSFAVAPCLPLNAALVSPSNKYPPLARIFAIADGPNPRRGRVITRAKETSSS